MLSVRNSASRTVVSLDGVWRFQLDPEDRGQAERWFATPLPAPRPMPVPASYNDITIAPKSTTTWVLHGTSARPSPRTIWARTDWFYVSAP
ncbi:hypothetical protein [Actinomyces sp. Z16]|uniref:hypothetical protein n=1 Tax=Actinomyces sp. Z16 TaxID=2079536 RepID=UPI0019026ED6|nr:hypothetical protein [Actinomyces sp. Z16]